uniref:HDC01521 n=1 Tax=Drosophila melanogaster TaxID=7227 RepID=Q6IHR5_DROME|nr:TPA_inf: HDC01521 [Drosophila melanogaster]
MLCGFIKPIPPPALLTAIKSTRLTVRIEFNPGRDFGSDRRTQSGAQFFVLIRLKPSETAAPNSETHVCYTESRMEHTNRFQSTCFPKSVFHFGKEQNPTPLAPKDQPSCQDEKSGPNRGPGVPVPVRNQLCRRFVRIKLCTGGDQCSSRRGFEREIRSDTCHVIAPLAFFHLESQTPPLSRPHAFNYCAIGTAFLHFLLLLPLANDF